MAVGASPCLVSSCRISHFGMKPVNGGRPPRDRRRRGASAVSAGAFAQEEARVLIFVAAPSLNTRNVEVVIIMYDNKARRANEGENCMTRTIQPRWAIEE